jgi:hypothetical protein
MVLVVMKRSQLGFYLKKGFTLVRRYQQGDEPNDLKDCFEVLERCISQRVAEKARTRHGKGVEIIEVP